MSVGKIATKRGHGEREFRCGSCGYKAILHIEAIGEGVQSILNPAGTADRRADRDLVADLERVASVTRCPVCKFRDPAAVRRWWRPHLLWGIGLSAVLGIGAAISAMATNMRDADRTIAMWFSFGLFVFMAAGVLGTAALKWSGIAARVSFREDPSVASRYDTKP